MLRRSQRLLVMEGIPSLDFGHADSIGCLPILQQDLPSSLLHEKSFPGLYKPQVRDDTRPAQEVPCRVLFNRRLLTALPCTIGNSTLLVPFLVDTASATTHLHRTALAKFELPTNCVSDISKLKTWTESFEMVVSTTPLVAHVNHVSDGEHFMSHLNILGMDYLQPNMPDLARYFSSRLGSKECPPPKVWVCGCNRLFKIRPPENTVRSLIAAAEWKLHRNMDTAKMNYVRGHNFQGVELVPEDALCPNTSKTPYTLIFE